jgi:hypothetical protein
LAVVNFKKIKNMDKKQLLRKFLKWQYDDEGEFGQGDDLMVETFLKEFDSVNDNVFIVEGKLPNVFGDKWVAQEYFSTYKKANDWILEVDGNKNTHRIVEQVVY